METIRRHVMRHPNAVRASKTNSNHFQVEFTSCVLGFICERRIVRIYRATPSADTPIGQWYHSRLPSVSYDQTDFMAIDRFIDGEIDSLRRVREDPSPLTEADARFFPNHLCNFLTPEAEDIVMATPSMDLPHLLTPGVSVTMLDDRREFIAAVRDPNAPDIPKNKMWQLAPDDFARLSPERVARCFDTSMCHLITPRQIVALKPEQLGEFLVTLDGDWIISQEQLQALTPPQLRKMLSMIFDALPTPEQLENVAALIRTG